MKYGFAICSTSSDYRRAPVLAFKIKLIWFGSLCTKTGYTAQKTLNIPIGPWRQGQRTPCEHISTAFVLVDFVSSSKRYNDYFCILNLVLFDCVPLFFLCKIPFHLYRFTVLSGSSCFAFFFGKVFHRLEPYSWSSMLSSWLTGMANGWVRLTNVFPSRSAPGYELAFP